ncbi:uncharacterized protein LOC102805735 [Saccoglossus kowalevskii]|uniref:Uncharacterized protein LOC102805735 n=1 Tax=Saccoglossus kowalevskii TaxID=10224 RepID=A0ABM0MJI2_SACKO|nr:PREDICTED: uncharacterized protein LOC102805735 [Saccoglossus kowalevskii]
MGMSSFVIFRLLFSLLVPVYGLNPEFAEVKTWWSKQITTDYYTAGRLSTRQVKYAGEVGFKSLFAVVNHTTPGHMGTEALPITSKIKTTALQFAEVDFDILPMSNWRSMNAVLYFNEMAQTMTKPLLVYCTAAYSSTAIVLLNLLYMTKQDPRFEPKVHADDFFRIARVHGFDFDMDVELIELVSHITGETPIKLRPKPNNKLANWGTYWHSKFVSSDWFAAGQMREGHLPAIIDAGFNAVINIRRGLTQPPLNIPSQEEVTLLNIEDFTGTYKRGGRQNVTRLLETRLDPDKPNKYITPTSEINYELRNEGEFGDDIGYNEEIERDTYAEINISYFHLPVAHTTADLFYQYLDAFRIAAEMGHVLVHCRSGYRAAVWTLLAEGYFNCRSSDWALKQAGIMGYHFTRDSDTYGVFTEVLDSDREECRQKPTHIPKNNILTNLRKFAIFSFFAHMFGL